MTRSKAWTDLFLKILRQARAKVPYALYLGRLGETQAVKILGESVCRTI